METFYKIWGSELETISPATQVAVTQTRVMFSTGTAVPQVQREPHYIAMVAGSTGWSLGEKQLIDKQLLIQSKQLPRQKQTDS